MLKQYSSQPRKMTGCPNLHKLLFINRRTTCQVNICKNEILFCISVSVAAAMCNIGCLKNNVMHENHARFTSISMLSATSSSKQDYHYASILGLSVCIVMRIISTKKRSRKAHHDLPHPACTFVCDTSGSKLRKKRHWGNESTHVNILLSLAMTMGSTSCKPSQDVLKRSREQIQRITISTPQKIKKLSAF